MVPLPIRENKTFRLRMAFVNKLARARFIPLEAEVLEDRPAKAHRVPATLWKAVQIPQMVFAICFHHLAYTVWNPTTRN